MHTQDWHSLQGRCTSTFNECVLCGEPITPELDSDEHIIPNSIGGQTTTRGFICRPCNSSTGDTWDAVLAQQLHSLSAFFNIVRDRGEVPPLPITTTAGESLMLQPGQGFAIDKPSLSVTPKEQHFKLNVSARSMREARKMLTGLKRKFPKLDVDVLMQAAQSKAHYPEGMVKISTNIEGNDAGRSIVKTALAFAHSRDIPTKNCGNALDYLQNSEATPSYGFFNISEPIVNRQNGVPLHCVAVVGYAERSLLVGYVEFFGLYKMVVILSDQYVGPNLSHAYAINPMTGNEVEVNFHLDFKPEDIPRLYDGELTSRDTFLSPLQFLIPTGQQASFDLERERVVKAACEYAAQQLGITTDEISPSLARQYVRLVQGSSSLD